MRRLAWSGARTGALVAALSTWACRCAEPPGPGPAGGDSEAAAADAHPGPGACPPPAVIEHVHAVFYLIERDVDPAEVERRMRDSVDALDDRGGYWQGFVRRAQAAVSRYAARDPDALLDEESLRAELQYSPCLDEAEHARMHARLDAAYGGP